MNISPAGIALIKRYEQLRLRAYLPLADDVLTIGWGHTGPDVYEGQEISEDEANDLLVQDLREAEDCIAAVVDVELTQAQYDALCSFVLNVGCGAFKNSTMCRLINAGRFDAAQQQFKRWNKQAGEPVAGLTRRRAEEAALFHV